MNNEIDIFDTRVNEIALRGVNLYASKSIGDRLTLMTKQLKDDEMIGIKISLGETNEMVVFSSENVQITSRDCDWMFDGVAVSEKNSCCTVLEAEKDEYKYSYFLVNMEKEFLSYEYTKTEDAQKQLYSELVRIGAKIFITATNMDGEVFVDAQFLTKEPLSVSLRAMFTNLFTKCSLVELTSEELVLDVSIPENYVNLLIMSYFFDLEVSDFSSKYKVTIDHDIEIEELNFSVRTYNCLKRSGKDTVNSLIEMSFEELRRIRNLGKKGAEEVERKLRPFRDRSYKDIDFEDEYKALEEIREADNANGKRITTAKDELDGLVGLHNVKLMVRKIASYARMMKAMNDSEMKLYPLSLNTAFYGNPGTAKTTVARILAKVLFEMGILKSDKITELGRSNIVGRYVGHTASNVSNIFEEGMGGLIFIDEAYSLVDDSNSYGQEAINAIVQEMENHREDTVVVFAGYPEEMKEFFACNPGFKSRIQFHIDFDDYSADELMQITKMIAQQRGFRISEEAEDRVKDILEKASTSSDFGNGRFCRNLVEAAILNFAFRKYSLDEKQVEIKEFVLTSEDFTEPENVEVKNDFHIGFV